MPQNPLNQVGGQAYVGPVYSGQQKKLQGAVVLRNLANGAFETSIKSSNSATAKYDFVLPPNPGTSGYVLQTDGVGNTTWVAVGGGGGGTPGGSPNTYQYNAAGSFGGISGITTTDGTDLVAASGKLKLSGSGSGTVILNAPATGGGTLTLPAGTDTIVSLTATQTLTNKTLTAPNLDTPISLTLTNAIGLPLTTGVTGVLAAANMAAMTATVGGAVPTPPNNTTTFLRGDGTFAAPSAGSGITINSSTITGGTPTRLLYDNAGTVGEISGVTSDGTNLTLASASLTISGNISAVTWGGAAIANVTGVRLKGAGATLTDTTATTGTTAVIANNILGGNTLAASNTGVIYTNAYELYVKDPVVGGTNVTMTNKWALGADSLKVAGASLFTNLITLTPSAAAQGLILSTGGSNTGSNTTSAVDISWTLNTSGSPDVVALRITDTARGGSTKLLNIYAGASGTTSVFNVDRNGLLSFPNSSSAGLQFGTGSGASFSVISGNSTSFAFSPDSIQNTYAILKISSTYYNLNASNVIVGWTPSTSLNIAADTAQARLAPANIRQGLAPSATPVNQTLTIGEASRGGTDSNVGGANGTVQSGLGTGTGTLSSLILQSPKAAASGTTAQTYVTGMTILAGTAVLTSYTVANLPAAATAGAGATAFVTDASTTLVLGLGGAVTGGGANKVPVYSDGTNWNYG